MALTPTSPQIARLLTEGTDLSKASLATRIMIARIRTEVKLNPACRSAKVDELLQFAANNAFAAADIAKL